MMGIAKESIVLKDKSSAYFILISHNTVKQHFRSLSGSNSYQPDQYVGTI